MGISLRTDKNSYAPGETIDIEVSLSFSKPVKARSLSARLACHERKFVKVTKIKDYDDRLREQELGIPGATNLITSTHEEEKTAFETERQLAGSREYNGGEVFKVQFRIPENASPTSHEFGHDNKIHVWTLDIKLDIPFAPDKHAEKEIFVSGLE